MENTNKSLLPVKSDFIFKLIFGDERNTDILTSFLLSVLDIPNDELAGLIIVNPYTKKETENDKQGILDVRVNTKTGKVIHIEIQVQPVPEMIERTIFYQSKMVTEQISSGQDWSVIKKSISIIITDYDLILADKNYHHQFRYRTTSGVEYTDLTEINTLELSKLPHNTDNSDLWHWMKFIKADSEEVLNMLAQTSPQMGKAVGVLKELSADEQTRMLFEARENERRDWASRMGGAVRDAKNEVAINAIKMGMPTETIVSLTGLTHEEIEALMTSVE
ncbi:MAG: Rpn family recombination-promoting nuclease/putative transposase [Defluviitaleaceae bacterium]|nr:Rpn family recombination-promoting nuclease/putative transposase [Defluviitaleaceae bacterium]